MAANNAPASTSKTRPNRLPAPALFVGPPSNNASALSLPRIPSTGPPAGPSKLSAVQQVQAESARNAPAKSRPSSTRQISTPPLTPRQTATQPSNQPQSILDLTRSSPTTQHRPRASRSSLEAQWSELQRTLNEVELAAPTAGRTKGAGEGGVTWTAGATVFGTRHAEALTRLRDAQIKLAEAWGPIGRDEGEQGAETDRESTKTKTEASAETRSEPEGADQQQERRQRDGEVDLKIAAERRQKNEEYFAKVKAGVQDVVAKLGEVSRAMKQVEGEGREIWEDSSVGAPSRGDGESVAA